MITTDEWNTYLKVRHELHLEDARCYMKSYLENYEGFGDDVTEEQFEAMDFESMVRDFEDRADWFDPTAEVWENVVRTYLADNGYQF